MEQVGPALLLAEHVVARGDVEQQDVAVLRRARHLVHEMRGRVHQDVARTVVDEPQGGLDQPALALRPAPLELELHADGGAHELGLLDRDLGPDVGRAQGLGEVAREPALDGVPRVLLERDVADQQLFGRRAGGRRGGESQQDKAEDQCRRPAHGPLNRRSERYAGPVLPGST